MQELSELLEEFPLKRPLHYHRDGTPIIDNELFPAYIQGALLFETEDRTVGCTKTLYGEKLSTVFLGLDHSFGGGPPILFETMLFAPEKLRRTPERLRELASELSEAFSGFDVRLQMKTEEQKQRDEENARREAYLKKYFPHDQLQLRYSTENEAADSHEALKMQCLIPPRWRHFLLWTIGRQTAWKHYDDEDEDE